MMTSRWLLPALIRAVLSTHTFDDQKPLLPAPDYKLTHLRYAAFGDSWASGINYGPPNSDLEYDFEVFEEVCRCRRINNAYPVQLRDDPNRNWTSGRIPDLDFQACHGALFDATPDQVARLDQRYVPELATLMIGGNNVGFADIIEHCIYQFDPNKDYGAEYPHPNSSCTQQLARANDNVRARWFKDGIRDSISAILNEPRIKSQKNFRLYVLGYAGLFNHDDPACNNQTFGFLPGKQQHLSTRLRRDMNGVIDAGRTLYQDYIEKELRDRRVKWVDINPVFANHRFCEPTSEGTQQAQVERSWLWNLQWPDCVPLSMRTQIKFAAQSSEQADPATMGFCRKCGDWAQYGEVQRPFHPKPEGHAAIKNLLLDRLAEDAKRSDAASLVFPWTCLVFLAVIVSLLS